MSIETRETGETKETGETSTLNEIWPDLSKDLAKLRINISEYGYNKLYSRYFVNKLLRLYTGISERIGVELLVSLLAFNKPQTAYITMTIIKCSILLRERFRDNEIFGRLRVMLLKKIDEYMKYLGTVQEKNRIRYRGLKTLLNKSRIELA
jgi:hypothetical protein